MKCHGLGYGPGMPRGLDHEHGVGVGDGAALRCNALAQVLGQGEHRPVADAVVVAGLLG